MAERLYARAVAIVVIAGIATTVETLCGVVAAATVVALVTIVWIRATRIAEGANHAE